MQSRICARHSGERATRRVKRRTRGGEVGGPQVAVREMERKRRMEESGARSLPRKALSQRVRVAFDRPPMGGNGWHWSAGDWSGARPSIHVTEGPWSAGGWWRWRWQWAAAAGAIMISPCCTCSGRILGDCLEARNARVEKVGPFAARAARGALPSRDPLTPRRLRRSKLTNRDTTGLGIYKTCRPHEELTAHPSVNSSEVSFSQVSARL